MKMFAFLRDQDPLRFFQYKYNVMFVPYLLYKKTTQCTFACVTLLDCILFRMAELSKLPGPVQTHKATGDSD